MATEFAEGDPVLIILLAGLVGYIGYTGAVIDTLGMKGLSARQEQVVAIRDTIAQLEAATDSAKKELARGTVEDLRKRLERTAAAWRCCGGWCRSGTRCPTCSTTSRPGARSAA